MIKDRVLSYTPHIHVERISQWPDPEEFPDYNAEAEWRGLEAQLNQLDGIKSTYALVNDYVLIERFGAVGPATMQAIDTANEDQTKSLQDLITKGNGSADMGLGENVVISSNIAKQYGLEIGDNVQVHTNRNLQQVKPTLERVGSPLLAEQQAEAIENIKSALKNSVTATPLNAEQENVPIAKLKDIYGNQIIPLLNLPGLRIIEGETLNNLLYHLEQGDRSTANPDDSGVYTFPLGHIKAAISMLDSLSDINPDREDISDIKNMQSLVLPKDLTVIGIYQATPHAISPDLFVPLPVGQDLTGIADGVRGIALVLDNPYDANEVINECVIPSLSDDVEWQPRTWMQDHQQHFALIKTQRQLLSFCLSFIMLVSAFSIMAVMFTVTIQKKREIGVMKALGAAPSQLIKVFLYQGVIIGFFGGLLGLLTGYLVVENRLIILDMFARLGFDPFPAEFNGFDELPAILNPTEFVGVFIFAFIMCIIATLVPAFVASRSDAAKSLRNM